MKKIIGRISNVLCIFLIIVLSIFEILKFANVIYVLQVKTGSMETNIHVGDYILVKNTKDFNTGDIITFKIQDYYVTHRVKSINGDRILTKGDANNTFDDEIMKDDVIGKVVYKGALLNFVFKFRALLVIIAIAFFVISCLLEDSDEKEKERKDKKEKELNKEKNNIVDYNELKNKIEKEVKVIDKELEDRRTKELIDNEVKRIDKELEEKEEELKLNEFKKELKEEFNKEINNNSNHKKKKKKKKKHNQENNNEELEII